ncbi:MAG: hypothetical protein J6K98_04585 [Clostridia bacterium]|nr:hypothetical protein [Clostridia bacterium]
MALKGTTVIELTNVRTGEKERYVEHNLITKALEYLYQPIGALKSPTSLTTGLGEPAYTSMLGGIALWDSTIDESSEIITQPHGVKMVGCASWNQTNTTASPRRGSYNPTESYLTTSSTERSMKFVYDFTTSQANGTIKCVSLTNWKSGWNGFGGNDNYNDYQGSNGNYDQYMGFYGSASYWFSANLGSSGKLFLIDPAEDVFYQLSALSTDTLTIAKRRANIRSRSMFQHMWYKHDLIENITITLPTKLSGVNTYFCNYDTRKNLLYIMVAPSGSSVASSGDFYVISVDMDTKTATVHEMKNKIGATMYFSSQYMVCHNGYLYYIYADQYYVRKISLSDSSYSSIYIGSSWYAQGSFVFVANEMVYFRVRKTVNNSTKYSIAMLDPDDESTEILGDYYGPYRIENYALYPAPIKGHPLHYYYFYTCDTSNNSATAYLWVNTKYLATINNLARPIEKTSDKTMKITYTIQEM